MFKRVMNSVSSKFTMVIMMGYIVLSLFFVYFFTMINESRIDKERRIDRIKADKLIEIVNENIVLKASLKLLMEDDMREIIYNNAFSNDMAGNIVFPPNLVNPKMWEIVNRDDLNPIKESLKIEKDVIKIRETALKESFKLVIWSGVVLLIALLLLKIAVKFFVINPVRNIVAVSEKFASGDLSVRISVRDLSQTPDELTRLGWAFNRMATSLEDSILDIRRKEFFQQALIDAIPDAIRVIDSNYNIVLANKAYFNFFKNREEEGEDNLGKCYTSSHSFKSPCQKNITMCPLSELCKNKQDTIKVVQRFKIDDERELPVEVNAALLKANEYQQESLVVESIRDLTQDIRFSHTQKLSSVGMLAAGVAHELRNPLGAIRLILDGIVSKIEKNRIEIPEIDKYLRRIIEQIENCANVTEILLKMSRLPSDELEEVNVNSAINEVKTLLDYESKKKGIVIETRFEADSIVIMATESEFRMVLLNLLQNAFNAMKEGGKVFVTAGIRDEKIRISVIDEGSGIPPDVLSKIFDPFFSTRATKDGKGTGIGLTITKSMVERHRGIIGVDSIVGKGTTFYIDFPLYDNG